MYIQGYSTYNNYDYLNSHEKKDMKESYKSLKKRGWQTLHGSNSKALMLLTDDRVVLKSYYTNVLVIEFKKKAVIKLWDGYSVTTLKHVNLLLNLFGYKSLNKREFMDLETDELTRGLKL